MSEGLRTWKAGADRRGVRTGMEEGEDETRRMMVAVRLIRRMKAFLFDWEALLLGALGELLGVGIALYEKLMPDRKTINWECRGSSKME